VNLRRRLIPYVLLGILLLGTGLGAGLGVAAQSGPAAQPEVSVIEQVPGCKPQGSQCDASGRKFRFPVIPKGLLTCEERDVAGITNPRAFARAVDVATSRCERSTGERPHY
jgi:hypothetical protein